MKAYCPIGTNLSKTNIGSICPENVKINDCSLVVMATELTLTIQLDNRRTIAMATIGQLSVDKLGKAECVSGNILK